MMKKFYLAGLLLSCAIGANSQIYTFTTAGISGHNGPTQTDIDAEYTATTLDGMVTINTQGIQEWIVPVGGTYLIEVYGSAGGTNSGYDVGYGAYMSGEFNLTGGMSLSLIVGQLPDMGAEYAKGGGGGSFVWETVSTTPLIIAGGGGGASNTGVLNPGIIHASSTTAGGFHTTAVAPGEGGSVTDVNWAGGGGAGWNSNGAGVNFINAYAGGGGIRPLEGGFGGDFNDVSYIGDPYGGFGGGGGSGVHMGGAGGGYTGGEGGGYLASVARAPGGGGSYNTGANQSNASGDNSGEGYIVITILCDVLTTTVSSTNVCEGELVTLDAVSTNGGTITWDNGVTNNVAFAAGAAGMTTFTATSSDPQDCSFSVDITINAAPTFTTSTTDEIAGNDGAIDLTITSGTGPFLYDWDNDGTGDTDDTEDLSGLAGGDYVVVVEAANGCTATSTVTVNSQLGIDDSGIPVNVFPNPTTGMLTVQLNGQFDFAVLNMLGEVVTRGSGNTSEMIDLSAVENGTYFLQIASEQATIETIKIVKL